MTAGCVTCGVKQELARTKPSEPTTSVRILIVEDDALIRSNQKLYLSESGYSITEASTADEAQLLLRRGTLVDIVITDISMPGSLSGEALAEWLAVERPDVPVILTSALGTRKPLLSRRHRFIAKPYDLAEMVRIVQEML